MTAAPNDAAGILARGARRGIPVEEFSPVWSSARLRLSRASWQEADLQPFLNSAVPYVSTSSGRLSEDAVTVALAALPGRGALRILELGSGSGVFARLFLDALQRQAPDVYAASHYIVTDGSDSILAAQSASGILDDHAGRIDRRRLDLSAEWPAIGRFDLILGSYILDSLPFDFLALNGMATWRREIRAFLPDDQAAEAEALAEALRAETSEALRPHVALGPRLSCHTRHVAVDRATLAEGRHLPRDTGGATLPFLHSHGALSCIAAAVAHLTEGGIAVFSDYGHLTPYQPRETPEFQTYGLSIAAGVNFPQVEDAFGAVEGMTLFRPTEEDGHLYTRVLRRGDGPDLSETVDDLYGALRHRALQATVDAAREFLRGRMYESARRCYAMALDQQPRNWALMQEIAASLHAMNGEQDEALDMATLGLTLNPLSPDLWRTRAESLLALGRTPEARAAIDRAVALAPTNIAAFHTLARIAHVERRFGTALQAIATALTHDADGDSQEGLLATQTQVLADIARAQIATLIASANPFRPLDTLPGD